MSSFVITGGAGFIGSHLVEELLQTGQRVVVIDNLQTGAESNISDYFENENFSFINHNLINGMPHVAGDIEGVFHLASPASPNIKSPRSYMSHPIDTLMVNSLGTRNVLEFARHKNAKVLYASSSEVYGDPDRSPQKEEYNGNVNPNGPRAVYDEGKRFGEAICSAYARTFTQDVRIIRLFNTYGDRMQKDDGRVVSNFINQAISGEDITIYGDGKQTRSFCYISDMISGLILAMEKNQAKGEVINLGNPDEHTIKDLAEKIKHMTQSESKIVHEELPVDDPHQRRPDISKAKELLGYTPKVNLEEGLKRTIEYFRGI